MNQDKDPKVVEHLDKTPYTPHPVAIGCFSQRGRISFMVLGPLIIFFFSHPGNRSHGKKAAVSISLSL